MKYPSIFSKVIKKSELNSFLTTSGLKSNPAVFKPQVFQIKGYVPLKSSFITGKKIDQSVQGGFDYEHVIVCDYVQKNVSKVKITSSKVLVEDKAGRVFQFTSSEYAKQFLNKGKIQSVENIDALIGKNVHVDSGSGSDSVGKLVSVDYKDGSAQVDFAEGSDRVDISKIKASEQKGVSQDSIILSFENMTKLKINFEQLLG